MSCTMNASDRLPGIVVFDDNTATNWKRFEREFRTYLIATEKNKKQETVKVNLLLHAAGSDAQELFENFDLEEPVTLEKAIESFKQYCEGSKNIIYERYIFNNRLQKEHESTERFINDLKELSKSCDYGTLKNDLIRDRIVCGTRSAEIRKTLLKKPDLTLEKAIELCKIHENTQKQLETMDPKAETLINAIAKTKA